ncbi:MAG: L-aspartate oxidase [Coriobacteriia bacterium]|nr:L-aspartate oxidase [Coriobacteriia bacterium]
MADAADTHREQHDLARERRTGGTFLPDERRLKAGELPEPLGRRYLLEFDTDELEQKRFDVLVVGSGIAGLMAALSLGPECSVGLVTKARLSETGTWYAQGGIAGAVGEADSVELHLADTLVTGQGLCDEDVVRTVVGEAADALAELAALGVRFDLAETGAVSLAREGGHSLPRVLHTGDATGATIQEVLSSAIRSADHVELFEDHFLVDLLTAGERCVGALVLDGATRRPVVYWADSVVLATGGCGQVYRVTTNPAIATGDGLAAAWRAGAEITDVEFVQFHPTALDHDDHPKTLITEALRGEGAYLLDCAGDRFMPGVHPLAELAPRDVVCREIESVMVRCQQPHVWLDARHLGEAHLRKRFPTIWERCREAGYDLAADLVPVAPAAHYMVGGVKVDLEGHTSIPGLFAAGEVIASGLHGANRLASNSLLEGVVFSRRIARALRDAKRGDRAARIVSGPSERAAAFTIGAARSTLQQVMTGFGGMIRSEGGLSEAATVLEGLSRLLDVSLRRAEELEVQNMITVAALITHAARLRAETRGAHSRVDFPDRDDTYWAGHLIWQRGRVPRFVPVAVSHARASGGGGAR